MDRVDLYAKDNKGKIRQWSIWNDGKYLLMEYGVVGGEMIENSEPVFFGLASRTKQEQIEMRMRSRINKKLDQGYCESAQEAASATRTNSLGYPRPMNAKPLTNAYSRQYTGWFWQYKLNGHRCLIINDAGVITAYSKGGKLIETIPEILSEINPDELKEGQILDGELYHHGTPLQTISSWVRRRQENTKKLSYMVFDANVEGSFEERYKFLKSLSFLKKSRKGKPMKARLCKTTRIGKKFDILEWAKIALEGKFEGLMLKDPSKNYQEGKRSGDILKVKRRTFGDALILDDEFLVVNILPSKDYWARLICETEHGVRFATSAPGDVPEKTRILKEKEHYIGKHIRVEFEGYTKGKKPVEAVAIEWREKHEE